MPQMLYDIFLYHVMFHYIIVQYLDMFLLIYSDVLNIGMCMHQNKMEYVNKHAFLYLYVYLLGPSKLTCKTRIFYRYPDIVLMI